MARTLRRESKQPLSPNEYLEQPYGRTIIPEDDGSFRAEIFEFPGCIALGDSPQAALEMLEDVARSWLEGAIEKGQPIPEPMENLDFSGRFVLRLPKSLHKKATYAADRDGVSLNQFIVNALAERIGERAAGKFAPSTAQIIWVRDFTSEAASSDQPTTLKIAYDKPIGRVEPLGEYPSHDILPLPTGSH